MNKRYLALFLFVLTVPAFGQTTVVSFSSNDVIVRPVFNQVGDFEFEIIIDQALQPGVYDNPPLVSVTYSVAGQLANTPSGFPAFALERSVDGAEFYGQGSSLRFEISANAVLSDGVQVAELVGSEVVFAFDGREIDNGRFHPALLELRANNTGRIQNSDNIVEDDPLLQVDFGEEYITDIDFDAGNLTLMTSPDSANEDPNTGGALSGGGSTSVFWLMLLLAFAVARSMRRSAKCVTQT